jgi:hypothetical protein
MVKRRPFIFPFERAIAARTAFDALAEKARQPKETFGVGEEVLCRGQLATVAWIEPDGSCGVTFSVGSVERLVKYKAMFGVGKGSARLLRPAPSLMAPPRAVRAGVSEETLVRVQTIFKENCATRPHTRDAMRRRLGRHVFEVRAVPRATPPLGIFRHLAPPLPSRPPSAVSDQVS